MPISCILKTIVWNGADYCDNKIMIYCFVDKKNGTC